MSETSRDTSSKHRIEPHGPSVSSQDVAEVLPILRSLNRQLRQANSLSLSFARGIMTGLGATVGVTFVLGLLVVVVSQVARAFGIETWAQPILEVLR